MPKSTDSPTRRKAPKFPLWKHSTGQWAKKIRGRYYYFGTDKDAALGRYMREREDLEAGRTPRPHEGTECTLKDLCNAFLTHKQHQRDAGEITPRTFADYYRTCELILQNLGRGVVVEKLHPEDLNKLRRKLAETRNPTTLGNEITKIRVVLRYAFENGLTDRPVRFGAFKKPKLAAVRRDRSGRPSRMFEAEQIRQLLAAADPHLRAMIFLGINCGFGNEDCGQLPIGAVDLDGGWIDFPRPKTGVMRRCPLWPETVEALRIALDTRHREKAPDAKGKFFVTLRGRAWSRDTKNAPISRAFGRLLECEGLRARGVGFYALRHTFQTIADDARDFVAVRAIMGHTGSRDIASHYRERISDERLRQVAEHVRGWLYAGKEA